MLQQNVFIPHCCNHCSFRSRSKLILVQHLFEAHGSEEEFRFTCGIRSCGHIFATGSAYSGYLTHCHRKHPNWKQQIEESTFDNSVDVYDRVRDVPDCNGISDDRESFVPPTFDVEESDTEGLNDTEENIELNAAHFLLTLKEKHKLTQVTLDFILNSISKLVKIISGSIKYSVLEKVKEIDSSIIPLLENCFSPVDPFCNLKTEYQQTRFYKEHFSLIVSCNLYATFCYMDL